MRCCKAKEVCDAANTGIEYTKQGTHWKGQCAAAKLLGVGPRGHGSKPDVSLIFDPEVRRELSPLPRIWSTGTTSLPWQQQPLWRKTVWCNREGASSKDTCVNGWYVFG